MSLLPHVVSVRMYDADDHRVVSWLLQFVPLPLLKPGRSATQFTFHRWLPRMGAVFGAPIGVSAKEIRCFAEC